MKLAWLSSSPKVLLEFNDHEFKIKPISRVLVFLQSILLWGWWRVSRELYLTRVDIKSKFKAFLVYS